MATLALFLCIAAALFLTATRYGIGARPDTFRYIGAGGWDQGGDAPLYGWILRAFISLGFGHFTVAKWVGLVLMLANTALIWLTLIYLTRSIPASALGTALILFSPQFLGFHVVALSEPLFILVAVGTLLLFFNYLDAGGIALLLACGVSEGLATLARFPAIVIGVAMAICLLARPRLPLGRRVRDICIIGGVGGFITGSWMLISQLTQGHSVGRDMQFHGNADAQRWSDGIDAMTALLMPTAGPQILRAAIFAMLLAATGWMIWPSFNRWRKEARSGNQAGRYAAPFAFGITALLYCGFVIFAIAIEANLPFNGRYAMPFYVFLTLAAVAAVAQGSTLRPLLGRVLLVVGCCLLLLHGARTVALTRYAYNNGIGFADPKWRASPTLQAVANLPADAQIYSNSPEAIFYVTGRDVPITPRRFHRRTGLDDAADPLSAQLQRVQHSLDQGNGFIVFLDGIDWRFYLVSEPELVARLNLREFRRFPDGRIYTSARPRADGKNGDTL